MDDDLLDVLSAHFAVRARLHEFNLGMIGQDAVEQLRGRMVRKTEMFDFPS